MKLLDLTLDTLHANLALDEALLEYAETQQHEGILRLWELPVPMVVLGRSSHAELEARLEQCREDHVEVGRRASGGAAIVAGPGCLIYSVVLPYETYPAARMIDCAHAAILDRLAAGLHRLDSRTRRQGISDLALGDRKFSGNSLRCRRSHFLYHGTLLYDFPLPLIERLLHAAPRQPEYRGGRTHEAFVINFPATATHLRAALIEVWHADADLPDWPQTRCEQLTDDKYATEQWRLGR